LVVAQEVEGRLGERSSPILDDLEKPRIVRTCTGENVLVNRKATRLQDMVDRYSTLVGAEVLFQDEASAWLSNDEAIASARFSMPRARNMSPTRTPTVVTDAWSN
jgi:hypothetical protein